MLCLFGRFVSFPVPCLHCTPKPPQFVYRADFRDPEKIFKSGFQPLGDNEDLIDHVYGNSCNIGGTKDAAFVATSIKKDFAHNFGLDMLWSTGDAAYVYVYKICATKSFYDVSLSLDEAFKVTGDMQYMMAAVTFAHEEEWVAYGGISNGLIRSVSIYKKDAAEKRSGVLVRKTYNPHYLSENTRANAEAFPVEGMDQGLVMNLVVSSSPNPISASFASCFGKKSARFESGGVCPMR